MNEVHISMGTILSLAKWSFSFCVVNSHFSTPPESVASDGLFFLDNSLCADWLQTESTNRSDSLDQMVRFEENQSEPNINQGLGTWAELLCTKEKHPTPKHKERKRYVASCQICSDERKFIQALLSKPKARPYRSWQQNQKIALKMKIYLALSPSWSFSRVDRAWKKHRPSSIFQFSLQSWIQNAHTQ